MNSDYPTVNVRSDDLEGMLRIKLIWRLPVKQRIEALATWQREQQKEQQAKMKASP